MDDVYEMQSRYDEAEQLHCKAVSVDPTDKQAERMYREFQTRVAERKVRTDR